MDILAQVFLPEQEISDQIVRIEINEGKLDKNNPYIVKKDNVRLYDDIASDYLNDALVEVLITKSRTCIIKFK